MSEQPYAETFAVRFRRALFEADFRHLKSDACAEDITACLERLKSSLANASAAERAQAKKIVLDGFAEAQIKNARGLLETILFPAPKTNGKDDSPFLADDPPDERPQDGVGLFREITTLIRRHVILGREQSIIVTLWIVHCYRMDVWDVSPILLATSATMRCGKSTLLAIVKALVPRALSTSNISAAALYRGVETYRPTLLIDEADRFLKDRSHELNGILNASHTRDSARVLRYDADAKDLVACSTWCAKFVAMIGKPESTLIDRSWAIELRRKRASERVAPISYSTLASELAPMRRRIQRWADDHRDELAAVKPELPSELNDRQRDNAKPLLAIAETINHQAAKVARQALVTLAGDTEDDEVGTMLLQDIKAWFDEHEDTERATSKELVDYLVGLEGRPWPEWRRGEPLKANGLARLLKPFGIVPFKFKAAGRASNGYSERQFGEVWERYDSSPGQDPPDQPEPWNQANKNGAESRKSNRNQDTTGSSWKTQENPINTESGSKVPDENPETGPEEKKVESDFDPKDAFGKAGEPRTLREDS